ncbi:hypothetical protein [Amycolatopsis sp. NPDC059021]|uniref:hypothetical protein n=1 Tax=Amycolatopsis sp. NPDC059021 TaxID=3346704 RepID=UPI00366A602E
MKTHDHGGRARRLLSALAGSTPAFVPQATPLASAGRARRLLSALAGTTAAFVPSGSGDEYTPALSDITDEATSQSATTPPKLSPTGGELRSGLGILADALAERPPHERLAVRAWLPLYALGHVRDLVHNLDRALDRAQDLADDLGRARLLALNRARDIARLLDLDRAYIRTLDLALDDADDALVRELARVLDRTLDSGSAHIGILDHSDDALVRELTRILDRALDFSSVIFDRDLSFARDLARDRTRDRARLVARDRMLEHARDIAQDQVLNRALARARALARTHDVADDLADDLDRDQVLNRTHDLTRALTRARARALVLGAESAKLIDAVSDFSGADLRQANLEDTFLDGVLWSDKTRWPHGWEERVRKSSVEISPGLYEIGRIGGSDHAVPSVPV